MVQPRPGKHTSDAAHVTRSDAGTGYFVLRCLPEGESPDHTRTSDEEKGMTKTVSFVFMNVHDDMCN